MYTGKRWHTEFKKRLIIVGLDFFAFEAFSNQTQCTLKQDFGFLDINFIYLDNFKNNFFDNNYFYERRYLERLFLGFLKEDLFYFF